MNPQSRQIYPTECVPKTTTTFHQYHIVDGVAATLDLIVANGARWGSRRRFVTVRADGKVVSSGGLVVSKDGKTMTGTAKGEDQKGRKIDNVEVYEKQ